MAETETTERDAAGTMIITVEIRETAMTVEEQEKDMGSSSMDMGEMILLDATLRILTRIHPQVETRRIIRMVTGERLLSPSSALVLVHLQLQA